jgi:putative transposase
MMVTANNFFTLVDKLIELKDLLLWIRRLLAGFATLLGNRGGRALIAQNLVLSHQLLVMQRPRRRAPNLVTTDRLLFGLCAGFLSPRRLLRTAVILKPATLLRFHRLHASKD